VKGVNVEAGKGAKVDVGNPGCKLHASRINMIIKVRRYLRNSVRNPHSSERSNSFLGPFYR
jgi:hypothetical protein